MMKNILAEHLSKLTLEITKNHPEGLNHTELVKEILKTGHRHPSGFSLSADLMAVVKKMTRQGAIQKNLDTRVISYSDDFEKSEKLDSTAEFCLV